MAPVVTPLGLRLDDVGGLVLPRDDNDDDDEEDEDHTNEEDDDDDLIEAGGGGIRGAENTVFRSSSISNHCSPPSTCLPNWSRSS